MTNEERDIIAAFIARVGGAAPPPGGWSGAASVPATQPQRPDLPPVDPDADRFIAQQFQSYPEARYRITQLAFVQEHALVEAQNRLRRLEWELQQTQQAAQQAAEQQQAGGQRQGGFFSGIFGSGRPSPGPAAPPGPGPWGQAGGQAPAQGPYGAPPPPQYPPGYQPGVFQRAGGSGFLGSALTTAAGVAGGMLAADAIRNMFSPHQSMYGGGFGGPMASPWGGNTGAVDQGAWTDPAGGAAPDQGYVDQGTWDQGTDQGGGDQSGWDDPGAAPDDSSGGDWGGGSDDDSLT